MPDFTSTNVAPISTNQVMTVQTKQPDDAQSPSIESFVNLQNAKAKSQDALVVSFTALPREGVLKGIDLMQMVMQVVEALNADISNLSIRKAEKK